MNSVFNNSSMWLLFIISIIIMNWNIEANPIDIQWVMHDHQLSYQKPFQINENNEKQFFGKFLHMTGN
jgi:hypothetical protein